MLANWLIWDIPRSWCGLFHWTWTVHARGTPLKPEIPVPGQHQDNHWLWRLKIFFVWLQSSQRAAAAAAVIRLESVYKPQLAPSEPPHCCVLQCLCTLKIIHMNVPHTIFILLSNEFRHISALFTSFCVITSSVQTSPQPTPSELAHNCKV